MLKSRYLTSAAACAFATIGGAAAAQEVGFCGQPEVMTQGTFSIADENATPIDATINVARGEPVYLEFNVGAATGVTIETFSNDFDPLVILFDSNGQMVRSDDDGSGTLNARLGAQLEPGDYCAQIRTLTDVPPATGILPPGYEGAIPVRLSTGIAPGAGGCRTQPGLVAIDTPLTPGGEPQSLSGQSPSSSAFSFTLAEPMAISVGARSAAFDTILTLEDSFGAQLGSDDDGGGGTNSYLGMDSPLPAGEYCVSVASYDAAGGDFTLTLEEWSEAAASRGGGSGAPADPCGDPSATTTLAAPLASGFAAENFSQTLTSTHQFFQFETTEPLELRLTATSGDFDTIMGLYDSDGNEVGNNDDGEGLGTNSRIQPGAALPAGTYCAAVSPYSGEGSGSFRFNLIEMTEEALLAEAYSTGEILPSSNSGVDFTDLGLLERSVRSDGAADGRAQWYLFEVAEESLIVADTASLGAPAKVVLFDYEGTGQKIAEAVGAPEGLTTRLVKKVGSGIYALAVVRDGGDETREASALSLQRYVRPPRAQ
ncbi:DVUA0089 family protein [Aliiroseovarius sp. YM-037]|uniref:DVUA0089 family protein n=1 Tax=Aliiroseovarius sp. YM-037 TaxID=3341728 RepID=UPI003A7F7B0E